MTALTSSSGHADHGPHVPKPREDCRRVAWHPPMNAESRRRILRWTCECRTRVYYLVVGGGLAYVRRSDKQTGQDHETARMRYREADHLWTELLLGLAS
ncbi:hypothetical protein Ssi03_61740 [Sphaerisporangium siamense]|uniref:Uncharacterized protein n=1 Tax=Sphaerisporangium siamense TaxID=795645 RepID=A0A7W7G963_9ACTN|nr:hypothetical protein [Sphaerisporangium siamense]MBB4702488.1 hypothetical protein [Sphaerisporangium siamense]GII88184.1 hypothetical protein Ssi03_61740 [Sphaerisporangium siamense]